MNCLTCQHPITNQKEIHGHHPVCFKINFGKIAEFTNFNRLGSDSFESKSLKPNYLVSHFSGNFRKYEVDFDKERYILKFQEPKCPELVGVEYLCNQIGTALNIPVAKPFGIIRFKNEYAFAVKNFLKLGIGPINLVHIYHYLKKAPYTVEVLINIIKNESTDKTCADIFLTTLLFDALIGNHDRHGRNFAFIETKNKKILSPIYDNISALGLESNPKFLESIWDPKGKIYTKNSKEPEIKAYIEEIKRLEHRHILKTFKQKLEQADFTSIIQTAPLLSLKMKRAFSTLINKRIQEFFNETHHL